MRCPSDLVAGGTECLKKLLKGLGEGCEGKKLQEFNEMIVPSAYPSMD